jgi:HK97 family phage portal protein
MFNIFKKKEEPKVVEPAPLFASVAPMKTTQTRASKALSSIGKTQADGATDTSYNNFMTTSDLVYSCMSYIAENVSQVRFTVGEIDRASGVVSPSSNTKLANMFNTYPNEYQTWTELLAQETLSLMLSGNSYTAFESSAGRYEMWNLLPPQEITPIIDSKNGMIKEYAYGKDVIYKRREIIHNKLPSAKSFHTGEPILKSLLDQLTLEAQATDDLVQFYENASVGSTVLTSEEPLTPKQADDLAIKISNNYSMKNQGRHKMFVLPNNLKPSALRIAPKDALILDSLEIAEDRVLQVFKLHKAVLGGASGNMHYTHNMEGLNEVVFNNAIRPYINRLKDTMQAFFQRVLKNPNLVLQIDYTNLPEIHRAILKHHETARSLSISGIISTNEARSILGLHKLVDTEYADKHFVPQYLIGSNFVTLEELDEESIKLLRKLNANTPIDSSDDLMVGADDPEGGKPNKDKE